MFACKVAVYAQVSLLKLDLLTIQEMVRLS